jgi:hypothetical protein
MSWDTVIGLVALIISLISLTLVIVFYFKSDKLYKEMLGFVTEIRTYTKVTYKDAFGMLKEGWGHLWDKESKAKIEDQAQREKDVVKKETVDRMIDEIEKIKSLANEGVKKESLQNEISKLEKKFENSIEEMYQKITRIDHEKTEKTEKSLSELIAEIIMKQGEIERSAIRQILHTEFGVIVSDYQVENELLRLWLLGMVQFGQKDGKYIVYSSKMK